MKKEVKASQISSIKVKYKEISKHLNEKTSRLWCAVEAKSCGYGGINVVHEATGVSKQTIHTGLKELSGELNVDADRVRRNGGGRKALKELYPCLLSDLEALIDPDTLGDPQSPLIWTTKSTEKLAEALRAKGYKISADTVASLLKELGYSLQSNRKSRDGSSHKDRDAQFHKINQTIEEAIKEGQPCISVDTKKKENIGNFKNAGQEYSPKGKPVEVGMHDFADEKLGKAIPYGVYNINDNKGVVSVGVTSDTAEFAVNSIRNWWNIEGKHSYSNASRITITADCGGSNGYRVRLWKRELQKLCNEIQKEIVVRHFPPGTSKWNKVEHKLFSFISRNWRARPLVSMETVINLISNTKTKKGLEVQAFLDDTKYEIGKKVSDEELKEINISRDAFHPEWNYSIKPQIA